MNTTPTLQNTPRSTRVASAGFATLMTLVILLGLGQLAHVDETDAQMAHAPAAVSVSAARS
jgi:hypothetical protein